MEKVTITKARNQFMKLPDRAAKHEVLAVTRKNKEVMAVMSWELYEGLIETLEILSDPNHLKKLSDAPEKQGKKLVKDLSGFRSLHVGGEVSGHVRVSKTGCDCLCPFGGDSKTRGQKGHL